MRQIFPSPVTDIDPVEAYDEPRPPEGRPWVVTDMVASVDGGTAVAGRSGGLGGPGDKAVFRALRSIADVILVGAGTARAENYRAVVVDDAARQRRTARGQRPVPRLALVSGRLDLDPTSPMFTDAAEAPLVFTTAAAAQRSDAFTDVAEVVAAGDDAVELPVVMAQLHERAVGIVLVEGGPTLNGQLVAAGFVDEWCLSVAPMLLAGKSARVAHGPDPAAPIGLELHRLLEEDGYLFATYRVAQ
ncbi:MAG TPA: pyrimidine reductase family protein [Acidimicrobiales bacterium]